MTTIQDVIPQRLSRPLATPFYRFAAWRLSGDGGSFAYVGSGHFMYSGEMEEREIGAAELALSLYPALIFLAPTFTVALLAENLAGTFINIAFALFNYILLFEIGEVTVSVRGETA